ncbi:MAG: glycosyltransferase [Geobacter sp.]|nr:glycosyltransferase [Geobacter sp.]
MKRNKIVHIINDLKIGGAEMMLYKLLSCSDKTVFEHIVVSIFDGGELLNDIRALGIEVRTGGGMNLMTTVRIYRIVRELEPDIIQGWMYYGNLITQMVALFLPRQIPILWNIRYSLSSFRNEKPLTLLAIMVCGMISRFPDKIINNSRVSAIQHSTQYNYRNDKWEVIPNGFDFELFSPSEEARLDLRKSLGIDPDAILIGMIARFHPQKDHATFLKAAAILMHCNPAVHFLLAGHLVTDGNPLLSSLKNKLGLGDCVHFLGERTGMSRITAALDVAVLSSSFGEGFSNAVGEAMSCGVPCVVTDISDLAFIVGDTGLVIPPKNPQLLAKSMETLVEMGAAGRRELGARARQRVIEHFSLEVVSKQYESVYLDVLSKYTEQRGR